jgi:triphosphoribosyl-dephospho-CoA synthase
MSNPQLSIGQCATLACLLEVTAPKPGNVHRGADFEDLKFNDFVASAVAIGPAIERANKTGVGVAVLRAVAATQGVVSTNTNLGTVLLLAPLAAVAREGPLSGGIGNVLAGLGPEDSRAVYEAIRLARPGGIGKVEEMDIDDLPPEDLLLAMQHAAERDLVARQYVTDFDVVLNFVVPHLVAVVEQGHSLTTSIIDTQMHLMSEFPDSLIARKCGMVTAKQSAIRASRVLDAGSPNSDDYLRELAEFDFWLRSDGHRRNPGTTADLIAAGLFVALRDSRIAPPFH